MGKIVLEIPDEVLAGLKVPAGEEVARLRQELAVRLYEKGLLTLGNSRRMSGLEKWDFLELLGREGVPRRYGMDDLEDDGRFWENRS